MPDSPKTPPEPEKIVDKIADKQIKIEKLEKIEHKEKIEKLEFKEKPEKIEHKEKPEKFEHKEKPEKFEHKEKPEKFEHKEKIEKFEHKELEKSPKLEGPEKPIAEINPKQIAEGPLNPGGTVEQRLAVLEQNVASLHHFITTGQRPDLTRGALSSEKDTKKPG
jgi:hypothetical protein